MIQSYEPSPEEIAARCREIQATWSLDEEQRRRKWCTTPPVEVVEVDTFGAIVE